MLKRQQSIVQFNSTERIRLAQRIAGFTLLELVLVLAVISVLVFLAVPNFHPVLREARLEQAVKQIEGDLQYARQLAITYGGSRALFSASGDPSQYAIIFSSTVKFKQLPAGVEVKEMRRGGVLLPDEQIVFDQNGSPGDADIQLLLEYGDEESARLLVKAVTGRVEVVY